MKHAVLTAARIIRNLEQARFHFEVTIHPPYDDPLLPPRKTPQPPTSIRIHVPDHPTNFFQPLTCIDIDIDPSIDIPVVHVRNLYPFRSPKSDATHHTLVMFKGRLKQHDACFPMQATT